MINCMKIELFSQVLVNKFSQKWQNQIKLIIKK